MPTSTYSWEFTLLRRPDGAGKARVAGRFVIEAGSAKAARSAAQQQLEEKQTPADSSKWSIGIMKPLTPRAPGTSLFLVTFAVWEASDDEFVRRDVHTMEVWAENASTARRIAQQDIQTNTPYDPSWRIREVARAGAARGRRRK